MKAAIAVVLFLCIAVSAQAAPVPPYRPKPKPPQPAPMQMYERLPPPKEWVPERAERWYRRMWRYLFPVPLT